MKETVRWVLCVVLGVGGVWAWNGRGQIGNDYVQIGVGGLGFIAMLWAVCWFCQLSGLDDRLPRYKD